MLHPGRGIVEGKDVNLDSTVEEAPQEDAPKIEGLRDCAIFSPGRVFLGGVFFAAAGLAWILGPGLAHSPAGLIVIGFAVGVPSLLKGIGLLQQAFRKGCYFRAGTDGIEIRLGVRGPYGVMVQLLRGVTAIAASPDSFAARFPGDWAKWDGESYVYRFRWSELASFQIMGPNRTLFLTLRSGPCLSVARFYFSVKTMFIAQRLEYIVHHMQRAQQISPPSLAGEGKSSEAPEWRAALVARIERSEIRDGFLISDALAVPGFRDAQSGLRTARITIQTRKARSRCAVP